MGAIDVKQAVKQMDGIFGCKVAFERSDPSDKTSRFEFTFAKKTIVDFFCGLFASADEKSDQSANVILALREIKAQVETDNNEGDLEKLVEKYQKNYDLIDFKEIRKTLRKFSEIKFPPVVFLRTAGQIIKTAEVKPGSLDSQQATPNGAGLNVSAPSYRSEKNVEGNQRSSENNGNRFVEENPDLEDKLEIEQFMNYDISASKVKKNNAFAANEEKADASKRLSIDQAAELTDNEWISGKEYWLTFYDNKLKAETFVQDGVTTIERDNECKITNENLEAFCEILIWVNKHEKMPRAIVGGNAKVNALVYEKLCKHNQDFAEKVKPILLGII